MPRKRKVVEVCLRKSTKVTSQAKEISAQDVVPGTVACDFVDPLYDDKGLVSMSKQLAGMAEEIVALRRRVKKLERIVAAEGDIVEEL